jgi:hypothetical protein
MPDGWRSPAKAELATPGDAWREDNSGHYQSFTGDFDGDGTVDKAELLVSTNGRRFGLFVFLGNGRRLLLLREKIEFLPSFGISKVGPSTFPTACGKGYWACKKGEPAEVTVAHDGILFFKSESAASVFLWSPAKKRFIQTWVSD